MCAGEWEGSSRGSPGDILRGETILVVGGAVDWWWGEEERELWWGEKEWWWKEGEGERELEDASLCWEEVELSEGRALFLNAGEELCRLRRVESWPDQVPCLAWLAWLADWLAWLLPGVPPPNQTLSLPRV